jgi:hypothetical protein
MTRQPRTPPGRSEKGRAARTDREARLAEALRDNLRKRKAQSRGRAAGDPEAPEDVDGGGGPRGGEA